MTTVAIGDDVHRRLVHLKEDWAASSMNEVIARLLEQAEELPASMFGADPSLPRLDRRIRQEMWE